VSGSDRLAGLIVLLGAGWVLYLLAPILTPFVASGLLAYLGDPLVDRLERLKLPRTLAVLVVFVLIFVLLGALTLLIVPLVRAQSAALMLQVPSYADWVEHQLLPKVNDLLGIETKGTGSGLGGLLASYGQELRDLASGALLSVSRSGGAVIAAALNVLLTPVITFYLLRDWDVMLARVAALCPAERRSALITLGRRTDEVLGGFMRGQVLVVIGLTVIYSVGLWLVGVDFALAIGVIAGLVSFVPYLGLIVGIALASVAALVQIGTLTAVGGVVLVFVVGQMIEGTLLTPRLVGGRIGLHPVFVIFSVLTGGQLFGFFGVLLALPAAAVISVLVRFAMAHYRPGTVAPVPVRDATSLTGVPDDAAGG
jgi:predicted PurR-regulated permease PerM